VEWRTFSWNFLAFEFTTPRDKRLLCYTKKGRTETDEREDEEGMKKTDRKKNLGE
jgi:hypothetical protein